MPRLPGWIRQITRPARRSAGAALRALLVRLLHAEVREGERGYAQFGHFQPQPHFSRIYLGGRSSGVLHRKLTGWDTASCAKRLARQHGLVLFCGPRPPPQLQPLCLRVPNFVALCVDPGADEASYEKKLEESARSDVRRCRRLGYRLETSRDAAWVGEFIERYHRPSMQARHESEGHAVSMAHAESLLREEDWHFLRICQGPLIVTACLARVRDGGLDLARMGWLDGDPAWPKQGSLAAMYWLTFARARELGLRKVRLGGTPPYPEDGLFQFKMKWNPTLDPAETIWDAQQFLLSPHHPRMHALLRERSLIAWTPEGKFAAYSARPPGEVRLAASIRGDLEWHLLRPEPPPADANADLDPRRCFDPLPQT